MNPFSKNKHVQLKQELFLLKIGWFSPWIYFNLSFKCCTWSYSSILFSLISLLTSPLTELNLFLLWDTLTQVPSALLLRKYKNIPSWERTVPEVGLGAGTRIITPVGGEVWQRKRTIQNGLGLASFTFKGPVLVWLLNVPLFYLQEFVFIINIFAVKFWKQKIFESVFFWSVALQEVCEERGLMIIIEGVSVRFWLIAVPGSSLPGAREGRKTPPFLRRLRWVWKFPHW